MIPCSYYGCRYEVSLLWFSLPLVEPQRWEVEPSRGSDKRGPLPKERREVLVNFTIYWFVLSLKPTTKEGGTLGDRPDPVSRQKERSEWESVDTESGRVRPKLQKSTTLTEFLARHRIPGVSPLPTHTNREIGHVGTKLPVDTPGRREDTVQVYLKKR